MGVPANYVTRLIDWHPGLTVPQNTHWSEIGQVVGSRQRPGLIMVGTAMAARQEE